MNISVIRVARRRDPNHSPQHGSPDPTVQSSRTEADVTVLGDLCHSFALNDLRSYRLMT